MKSTQFIYIYFQQIEFKKKKYLDKMLQQNRLEHFRDQKQHKNIP